uniref:Protein TOPAZ1 n=2 Tax=Lates calcarifer TaxID=8187 RepID=A0A4W6FPW8_LATCA
MSSEPLHQMNEVDTESFTCQRVRVYCRKINSSCARTYMPWPFSNTSRTLTAHAGATACPAEPVHPSARNNSDSPINQNQSGSPSSRTNDLLPSAPTDTTCQVSSQSEERREEDGEHIIVKRNGKRHGNMSSYSSDSKNQSKNMESAPCLMEAEESVASLLSDAAALYTPSQPGREPGTDAVSALSTPVNGPETNSSLSTPSPSSLGLSEWETATTTLSTMSSLFTHGGLSSLSATPSSLPPSLFLPEKVRDGELAEVLSASTSPRSHLPKHVIKAVEKPLFHCEETLMASCCSSPSSSAFFSHSFDSFQSCESSLLLPQDEQGSSKEILTDRSPPKLESYYITSPFNQNQSVAFGRNRSSSHNMTKEQCVETNSDKFMLPPLLSPVTSPQGHSCTSFLSPCCSDEEEEEEEEMTNKDTNTHEMLPGHHIPEIDNGSRQKCEEYPDCHQPEGCDNEDLEGVSSEFKSPSPHSSVGDESDDREEESEDETDYEDDVEQGNRGSQQVPLAPKLKANLTSGVVTDPCSSPSSDEGQPSSRDEGSSSSEIAGSERDTAKSEAAGDTQPSILDEFTAYEQDILLVDVIQDDPELFENLPQQSLLKLGPTRVSEAPKSRHTGVVKTLSLRTGGASVEHEQRLTPVTIDFHCDSPDITEESNSRPWRPQSSSTPSKVQNTWPATDKQTRNMGQSDANNNHVNGGLESRSQPIQTVNSPHNIPPLSTIRNGPWTTNPANMMDIRRQKSNSYCRQYFSESFSCGFKMCRFQHVPVEGDEKFCVETVTRFIKNPMCLQKAKAVFTGYYENNPPGVYFSMPVLLSLLWSLLKASMVSDVFSVLSVSLAHKIVPSHEFLLALFNFVREKGLIGSVPELMQLTFEMASAGLGLSLDCLDCVKNTPEFQQAVHPNSPVSVSGNHKLSSSTSFPECLNFAHSIVEIELCTKQEDWRRMGEVFRSFCQTSQHPNQVEQISGRIAIALLSESKDKLSLPFAAFAETVCQIDAQDTLIRSFLGRIGVSLMLRYHKTHQWAKGRRVVEVLSVSKVNYSTLKGLFGNEDGASRCCLVTVATELFLLSGSVEGALNTLPRKRMVPEFELMAM